MDAAHLQLTIESLADALAEGHAGALLEGLSGRVCDDSRQVRCGDVFVAVRGVRVDGHGYIGQAVERGAGVVVMEGDGGMGGGAVGMMSTARVVVIRVSDGAEALGRLAQAAAGRPSEELAVLGVTGTNGKTTVTWMVRSILRAAGRGCGLIGTTGYDVGLGMEQALWTTPGAVELSRLLGAARGSGLEAVAMECSSHALDQKRTAGIRFVGAAFTNLTGDHLDYHVTLGAYLDAKALLFEGLGAGSTAVLNVHDVASAELARRTRARVMRFGIGVDCEVAAEITRLDVRGTGFVLRLDGEEVLVECPLVGRHNVMNCLAAAGLAYGAGVGCDDIAAGLSGLEQVPGRLERVSGVSRPVVFVDYAHTDDGLEQVCGALRSLTGGRLVVVFGCGGDRDRTKRPRMARVAEKWADCIVVTDDNPRSESPGAIRGEVLAGFSAAGREKAVEIGDRGKAIRHAIATAGEDDVVLIAGKGHENYQIVGERVVEFDDRVVSRACLAEYGGGSVRASRMETT